MLRTVPTDTTQAEIIESLLKLLNWTYVSVIYEDTTDWKSRYEELRKLKTVCLSEKIIIYSSLSNINGSLDSLNEDNKAKVYILYGSDKMKKAVFQEASKSGIRNKTWILVHTSSRNLRFLQFKKGFGNEFTEIDGRFLFIFPNVGRDVEFEQHYLKSDNSNSKTQFANGKKKPIEAKDSNSGDKATQKKGRKKFRYSSVGFVRNAVMVFTSYWLNQLQAYKMQYQENLCVNSTKISNKLRNFNYVPSLKELNFKGLNNESIQLDNNGNVKNFVYNIFAINPTNIIRKSYIKVKKRNSTNNYRAGIKTTLKIRLFANWSSANRSFEYINRKLLATFKYTRSYCSSVCPPGYTNKTFNPKKPCCWDCVKCSKYHIKYSSGNTKCRKCAANTIPNSFRTQCISIKSVDIKYNNYAGIAILSTSTLCMAVNIVVIIIFLLNKQTPLVRSSSFKSSLCQLFCHLLLFTLSCLRVAEISIIQCKIVPAMFLLITTITAITVTKVTRILFIFRCRIKIKKEHIKKLKKEELAFVISCATLHIIMSVLLHVFLKTELGTEIEMNEELYEVYNVCYNSSTIFVANVVYVLVLEIVSGIQCFRGRNIPGQYNEAKYISYATYLSTVALCLSLILRHGIKSLKTSNLLQILLLILSNLSVLLSLYGYKVIIILFQPEKNTKKFFQNALWGNKELLKDDKRIANVENPLTAPANRGYQHEEGR